ncbi:Uma2 family endonuclease [Sporomusa ovata]
MSYLPEWNQARQRLSRRYHVLLAEADLLGKLCPQTVLQNTEFVYHLYEQAGVREYWVVHPTDHTIMVFKLAEDGRYGRYEMYEQSEQLTVGILPELILDLNEIFAE